MNTEDDEFDRIEREQKMRGVPDAIHHTDTSETLEYIQGWNDCRQAMLAEQPALMIRGDIRDGLVDDEPAQQEPVPWSQVLEDVWAEPDNTTPQPAQRTWVEVEQVEWEGGKLFAKLKELNT